jgi:16S rRNA C967 or C1407 C5-methylase (RsmB/RsmF family)
LESDLKRFHSKQLSILKNSFECLRRGGDLLYITCSTEPEENEDVIEEFLADQPGAGAIADFYRSFPGDSGAGGFFAAQIRRL